MTNERLLLGELANVEQRIEQCLQEQQLQASELTEAARALFTLANEFAAHANRSETVMAVPTLLAELRTLLPKTDVVALTLDRTVGRETALYKARANLTVKLERHRERVAAGADEVVEWHDDDEPTHKPARRSSAKVPAPRRQRLELEDVDTVAAMNRMHEAVLEAEQDHRALMDAMPAPSPSKSKRKVPASLPVGDQDGWIRCKREDDWLVPSSKSKAPEPKKQWNERMPEEWKALNRLDDYERHCESHPNPSSTRETFRPTPASVLVPESQPFD